ncbi:hypothetical protein BGZ57DRAFT_935899 [Hyaloscypha finlandica]|nr:hypothetical protein BGZ57DRAFT_935899 [Hyaloscypha finlandica]
MSTPQTSSNSSDSGDSSKTKQQAKRSVSLLTPAQLQRKRAQDREKLEKQVEFLTQELRLARLETASLQQKNQLSPPGTIPVTSPPLSMTSLGHYPEGIAAVMDVQVQQKSCPPQYGGMGSQFSNPFIISGPVSTGPAPPTILDPSLCNLYTDFKQQPISIQVWQAKPIHYPATCGLDKIFLDLVRDLNPLNSVGGNAYEFSTSKFPQVTALLNPQQHSMLYPVTSAIVQDVIQCLTVESLPEQIGILYVMCYILRWIITGTEEDYYAMPDWLRPGAAQLCTAHPIWVDIMPPKSRDRLCREAHYHDKFEAFKERANETISVNWPYKSEDTLIQMSPTEFALNPVFTTHIRTLGNWTYGPSFLKDYPEFEGEVNIGPPRLVR